MQTDTDTLGGAYASALAAKDFDAIRALFAPQVDFRALTPRKTWEATDGEAIVTGVLRQWFDDEDDIESLESLQTDAFAGCERVGYRFRVRNPEGLFLVEQQAYIRPGDDKIAWMRVVCSGFMPVD